MQLDNLGQLIATLRKEAGFTQKSLADALMITDKAISKWERGLCLPDSSMLPKLAGLLNTDLATLLPNYHLSDQWKGVLILKKNEISPDRLINGKPLIEYLLSYFVLLGITNICILNESGKPIKTKYFEDYGITVSKDNSIIEKTMVIYGQMILFGAYLTQQLKNMMLMEENVIPSIDGIRVPILFVHKTPVDIAKLHETTMNRSLYRGMVYIPLDTEDDISDAEEFIHIYEKHHDLKYCDLSEIASNRGLI